MFSFLKLKKSVWLLAVLIMASLMLPLAGPAQASHPTGTCLDLIPESDTNTVGEVHTITARLLFVVGITDPECLLILGEEARGPLGSGPVTINFDIIGPGDPDGEPATELPDLSCTIPENSTRCEVAYTSLTVGSDLIRGC